MKTLLCLLLSSILSVVYAADIEPKKNIAAGRVTFADGKPITGDIDDYTIPINGVSEAGEKVSYSPIIKNGAYKQKLVPGQYRFSTAKIKVTHGDTVYTLPLEPVGKLWNKNQDAEDGIVQDYVWKPTGQAPTYGEKANINNHTHWYGMHLGMSFQGYRSDLGKVSVMLPAGSKLVFTLTPLTKCIDGRDLQPFTIEREWRPKDITYNDALNDLPPASYEITGVAKLPDGSTRPILFQGRGDYPKYVSTGKVPLEPDNYGSYWVQLMGWATD
jgi:hypothetical protein